MLCRWQATDPPGIMYGWCTKCRDKYPEEYTWVDLIFILRVDLILFLRATSIFHSVSSSDFPCSNLTGNNCTYCGGSIEDNYPPAGELDHQDHPFYHPSISQTVRWTWSTRPTFVSSFFNYLLTKIILYQQLSTSRWTGSPTSSFISSFISSSLSSFIINYPPSGDQYSPVYQSSFTKRNIFFKLSFFSDCRGGPLLPLWHHRLLHAQRETMRQVQSKFLLKKTHTKMHSDNEQKHKALVFHWIGSFGGGCDKIWLAEEVAVWIWADEWVI